MLCKLPVSGNEITLRLPSGREDVLLCEWTGEQSALAHCLLDAVTGKNAWQGATDWGDMPITDIEWALLLLRRALFGDCVMAEIVCRQAQCKAKIDISFRISDYLGQFQAVMPPNVAKSPEPGWFSLAGNDIRFRLPTGNDRHAVAHSPQAGLELMKRCGLSESLPEMLLEQVEDSLEAMAPVISGVLRGACPECGSAGDFYFDVQSYVLQELIDQARFVFEDVHLLAGHYRWSENDILNLPRQRRFRYVEAIIRGRSVVHA